MKIKVTDWIAQALAEHGIRHCFAVTGGGAMHLNYSLGTHPKIECVYNHHEQACAMAADAYCRASNKMAVVNVTSGPGGTNAITGVYGAFTDSIAMLVLSGQVKYETTVRSTGLALRQYGDQELDIEELVAPVTKYCAMVTDPNSIRYHVEKALYLAESGRPGPVWLDVPLNVQGAFIDSDTLEGFDPAEIEEPWKALDTDAVAQDILAKISKAKRPVIFAGGGIQISGQHAEFIKLVEKLGVPVVTGWNAHDVIWNDHPLYAGRPGTLGDRGGNFVTQNADLLLILGSRLNIRQVSYDWSSFAREAYKIWIDVDELELKKPSVTPDMPVHSRLQDMLPALLRAPKMAESNQHASWVEWCGERQRRYPVVDREQSKDGVINPYIFMADLFDQLPEGATAVAANGSACVMSFQAANLKRNQRLWTNSGCAAMGYDLPAAIGASKAKEGQDIVCLAGDGSIMMNLQELQTIVGNNLPIKLFILNNEGYLSITQSQHNFFKGDEVGGSPKSGVNFPNFGKLMTAFGFPYICCGPDDDMPAKIAQTLKTDGPVVCEVMLDPEQLFSPKLTSRQLEDGTMVSPKLEDMAPFLSEAELKENMIIDS